MIWLLSIPVVRFLGKKVFWLYALNATLKNQRRARIHSSPDDVSQFSGFDHSGLHSLTHQLQELGFVGLGDLLSYTDFEPHMPASAALTPDPQQAPSSPPKMLVETETHGVARVFAHPKHGCYAVLVSVIAVSRFPPEMKRADMVNVAPFRTLIMTLEGNREDSWSFSTHNREVDAFSLLHRHPRQLSHRLVGAPAQQLLESHLAERDDIAARAGFRWDKEPILDKYQEYEARGIRHIRSVYERATTTGVAWHLMTYRLQKHERWMGELASR
jgi:hypothetical protein